MSDRDPRSPAGATPHRKSRRAGSTGAAPTRRHASRPDRSRFRTGTSGGGQSVVTFGQFFATLRRQLVLLLIFLVIGVGAAGVLLAGTAKKYQSTAVVNITPTLANSSSSTNSTNSVNTITETKIATSSSVALGAAKKLGFTGTPSQLAQHVTVTSPLSSQVLDITFSSSSAQGAADGANAFAQSYLDYRTATAQADLQLRISRISDQITALQKNNSNGSANGQISALLTQQNGYRTLVVTPGQVAGVAAPPSKPSSPKPMLYLAAGLLVGLLIGALVAVMRDLRDDRVRGKSDLEASLGAPVIAEAVSAEVAGKTWPRSLVTLTAPRGGEADAYRTVTATVSGDASDSPVVMLCSTGREGRSLAPMNLAASYALQGLRTVLAGPHASLAPARELLGVEPGELPNGRLVERLVGTRTLPDLSVLDLGDEVHLGATLRGGDEQLAELLAEADVVVLDGVNIELPSTSLRLGQLADEVVVLVYANRTTHLDLERLAQHLAQVRASISGAILLGRQRLLGRRRRPAKAQPVSLPVTSTRRSEPAAPATRSNPTGRRRQAGPPSRDRDEPRGSQGQPRAEQGRTESGRGDQSTEQLRSVSGIKGR